MTDDDPHDHRPQLVGPVYRVLGSVAEAEDAVQEAYLLLHRPVARHDRQRRCVAHDRHVTRLSGPGRLRAGAT